MGSVSRLAPLLLLAAVLLPSSGCMAIVHAPKFMGGTRGWINIAAGEKHWVARRAPRPYALASGGPGLGDLRPIVLPFAIFDFLPSLAVDLLLLPVSIPHSIGLGLEESRTGKAEGRRRQLKEQELQRDQRDRRKAREATPKEPVESAEAAERRRTATLRRREARRGRLRQPRHQGGGTDSGPELPLTSGSSQDWVVRNNEARAALAQILRAQRAFQARSPRGEYSDDLERLLVSGTRRYELPSNYRFSLERSSLAPTQHWIATASPRAKWPGARWFAVDSSGEVRAYTKRFAYLPADCTLESLELLRKR